MTKAVIALKYLESKFPKDLVEKVLEKNKGFNGYSWIDADGINTGDAAQSADVKGVLESQELVKAKMIYVFGETAPKLDEDLQPWELLRNSKNEIVCVGFFEGDFSGSAKTDSAHVPAYHAKETLSRKLKMMLRSLKDNGEELYEFCKHEDFHEEMKELFTGDGSVVLHFFNDQLLWFCSPIDRKKTNEFGMFSDLCGWEEPRKTSVPEVKAETKVVGKGLDKLKAMMDAKKSGTQSPPSEEKRTSDAPKPVVAPSVVPMERSPGNPTTYLDILKTKPLRHITEDKVKNLLNNEGRFRHLENWYKSVNSTDPNGTWPAGYDKQKIQAIWDELKSHEKDGTWKNYVKNLPGLHSKKDRDEARTEYETLVKAGLATDVGDRVTLANKVEATKDNVTKVVTPTEGTSSEGEFLPTVNEKSQEYLKTFVDKYFDKSHKAIPIDPTKLKAYQEKYPNILEKMGVKSWPDMFGLPLEAYQMITQRHDLARLAMFSMVTEIERLHRLVPASQQAPASEAKTSMLAGLPGARRRA